MISCAMWSAAVCCCMWWTCPAGEGRDPKEDFERINQELVNFSAELAQRPQIVLVNKCDIATPEQVAEFRAYIEGPGPGVSCPISRRHPAGAGRAARPGVRAAEGPAAGAGLRAGVCPGIPPPPIPAPLLWSRRDEHVWRVDAPWLERILEGSDVERTTRACSISSGSWARERLCWMNWCAAARAGGRYHQDRGGLSSTMYSESAGQRRGLFAPGDGVGISTSSPR